MRSNFLQSKTTGSNVILSNPARLLAGSFNLQILVLIISQIFLAVAMRQNSVIATIHALVVFGIGLFLLAKDDQPDRLITLIAYLTGAEILWRMNNAGVFWEFGKYALIVLLLLAIFKYQLLAKVSKWPLLFFILLLPALALLPTFDREIISFNLSGPLALAVSAMFFSTITLEQKQVKHILLALFLPIIGAAFLATLSTVTTDVIIFGRSSLKVTSGGFGPNQVSSILGLGALMALFYIFLERRYALLRIVVMVCAVWLAAQALLTFSRGGIFTTVVALTIAAMFLLRDRRSRLVFLIVTVVIFVLWTFIVFPYLNDFTGGALLARMTNSSLTGRDKIVQADLLAFRDHPLFGVGLGQSSEYHALLFRRSGSHTEFSRWLAEHGSFGLAALLIFVGVVFQRIFRKEPPLEKALMLSLTVWSILFMSHAAMRLAAPAFIFGLASVTFMFDDLEENSDRPLSGANET